MALNNGSTQYRNVPDLALVARDIMIFYTVIPTNGPPVPGKYSSWVGTSAAAPLFAGLVALANQQAAILGKPPVGLLNPALYDIAGGSSYPACFHDITNGNNTWSNTNANTSSLNLYYASAGYDLCTGWGTPAGTNLINALVGYAGPIWVNFSASSCPGNGSYATPYCALASGIGAVTSGGTICLVGVSSSPVTPIISTPMTLRAFYGPVTIGQ
jgi:subtilase family serine protease